MLILKCIYCVAIAICIYSVIALILSIKNKNKYYCWWAIRTNLICILYLISTNLLIELLYLPADLEIFFIDIFEVIAIVLFTISLIINGIKKNKGHKNKKDKIIVITSLLIIILPVLLVTTFIVENKILINKSELLLVYDSRGNGGLGDSKTFAFAVGDDYCKEFDLGIDISGYRLYRFIPSSFVKVKNLKDIPEYKVKFEGNAIKVYKNNKLICKTKTKAHYFNIDFGVGYIKK